MSLHSLVYDSASKRDRHELYEIYGVLGEGKYGVVLKARSKATEKRLAAKRIPLCDGNLSIDAVCEIIALRALAQTRNIVKLADVTMDNDHVYLILERLDIDLHHWRPQTTEQTFRVMIQLFGALASMHDMGIMHRDLSPSNIMLDATGILHIVDLGMCSFDPFPSDYNIVTQFYRAPEVFHQTGYDARIDVWSAACILYELTTDQVLLKATEQNYIALFEDFFAAKETTLKRIGNAYLRSVISQCLKIKRPTSKEVYLSVVGCTA